MEVRSSMDQIRPSKSIRFCFPKQVDIDDKRQASAHLVAWNGLLAPTKAFLQTMWGVSELQMLSRVKQGAVESPALFSLVADLCFQEAATRFGWEEEISKLPASGPVTFCLWMMV